MLLCTTFAGIPTVWWMIMLLERRDRSMLYVPYW
jgi:hypothetical protein